MPNNSAGEWAKGMVNQRKEKWMISQVDMDGKGHQNKSLDLIISLPREGLSDFHALFAAFGHSI